MSKRDRAFTLIELLVVMA
ncbi:MAG: prepilin-type N-terminal cleavage/methylation domain-containing protein, partial [Chthoniobacterales bacterium]